MKKIIIAALLLISLQAVHATPITNISITVAGTDSVINLESFRGKKILIINIASSSSYANQLHALEQLAQQHPDSLVVIAVPSNSFGNEAAADSTIADNLHNLYGATYIVAAKQEVTGSAVSPLYNWLENQSQNGTVSSTVKDDFQKYLIDERGNLMAAFISEVDPMDEQIQFALQQHYQ